MQLSRLGLTALLVIGLVAGGLVVSPATSVLALGTRVSQNDGNADLHAFVAKSPTTNQITEIWRSDDGSLNQVRAATSTDGGATWSNEVIVHSGNYSGYMGTIRVLYDSAGGLHALFWAGQGNGRQVRHYFVPAGADARVAANWQSGGVLCHSGDCLEVDVYPDNTGYIYIVYQDPDNQFGVRRRLGTAGAWSAPQIVSLGSERGTASIAVTPDGKVHLGYSTKTGRDIIYERYSSFTNWTQEEETRISSAEAPYPPDLTVDGGGAVHFAWAQDGQICHRQYSGGLTGIDCSVGNYDGGQDVSIAISGSGKVYITWNRENLKEMWQNIRTGATWGNAERLGPDADSGSRARWQHYELTKDGEIALGFIEDGTARYYLIEQGTHDALPPTVSAVSLAAPTTGQRATGTVSGTDTADVGSPSGIVVIQYSLVDPSLNKWVTAAVITATPSLSNYQFAVDLANPGAGGTWGSSSHTLRVRLIDAVGNVGAPATASPLTFTVPAVTVTRYLAEGYTGGTFDEYVTLVNPSETDSIAVSLTFQYAGSSTGTPGTLVIIAKNQRVTVSIDNTAGGGKELSIKLESDRQFFAERPMYFTNYPAPAGRAYNRLGVSALAGITGGHIGTTATAPAPTWYFAEGYTGPGFEGYFTIQNPGGATATVTITYFLAGGGSTDRIVAVGAGQRLTVVIHGAAGQGGVGENQSFSARLSTSAGTPIIAERVQYFSYAGSMGTVTGGTATLGATAPALAWYFAEGYTGPGFDEYLTIQNPNGAAGTATITYFVEGQATPTTKNVNLLANSRTTVTVHDASGGGLGRNLAHATKVEAVGLPGGIIVERPIYFLYTGPGIAGIDGGHNVMGATGLIAPNTSVLMAEGYTGPGFEQYLTFQNPNPATIVVTITYLKADGTTVPRSLVLPGNQRTTVPVHNASGAGLGTGQEFSTKVTVPLGAAGGILVERVNYFRYNNVATGGFAAFGRVS